MLQIAFIRENQEQVVKGLAKRNLDVADLLKEVLELDEKRRSTQVELDNVLAESNKLSKSIGELRKRGEKAKAEIIKEKTSNLRDQSKQLTEELNNVSALLTEKLYTIPNVPTDIVPAGKDADDNLNVFEAGEVPTLHEGALPHWELAKKDDIIDFELVNKITGA